jgi:hypothetical protein
MAISASAIKKKSTTHNSDTVRLEDVASSHREAATAQSLNMVYA